MLTISIITFFGVFLVPLIAKISMLHYPIVPLLSGDEKESFPSALPMSGFTIVMFNRPSNDMQSLLKMGSFYMNLRRLKAFYAKKTLPSEMGYMIRFMQFDCAGAKNACLKAGIRVDDHVVTRLYRGREQVSETKTLFANRLSPFVLWVLESLKEGMDGDDVETMKIKSSIASKSGGGVASSNSKAYVTRTRTNYNTSTKFVTSTLTPGQPIPIQ